MNNKRYSWKQYGLGAVFYTVLTGLCSLLGAPFWVVAVFSVAVLLCLVGAYVEYRP